MIAHSPSRSSAESSRAVLNERLKPQVKCLYKRATASTCSDSQGHTFLLVECVRPCAKDVLSDCICKRIGLKWCRRTQAACVKDRGERENHDLQRVRRCYANAGGTWAEMGTTAAEGTLSTLYTHRPYRLTREKRRTGVHAELGCNWPQSIGPAQARSRARQARERGL